MNSILKYSLIGVGSLAAIYGSYRGYKWYQAKKAAKNGESTKESGSGGGLIDEIKSAIIPTQTVPSVTVVNVNKGDRFRRPPKKSPPPTEAVVNPVGISMTPKPAVSTKPPATSGTGTQSGSVFQGGSTGNLAGMGISVDGFNYEIN
jgi:hypothetical protein